jgi:hypothetical protein
MVGLLQGCGFCGYALQNLKNSPADALDDHAANRRFRKIAKAAWQTVETDGFPIHYSADYADGFQAGFVDYLEANGTGEPPAAPPKRYRHSRYETPAGQQAINDWFAGFRHGTQAAQASGYRPAVVLPLALPPRHSNHPYALEAVPSLEESHTPVEPLPPPRVSPEHAAPASATATGSREQR